VGLQLDRGLYAPLIVEAQREELSYDREAVLVLDDWIDGVGGTPDAKFKELKSAGMNMGPGTPSVSLVPGAGRHTTLDGQVPGPDDLSRLANLMQRRQVDVGDVAYPLYLINGRPPEDPMQLTARKGDRIRLRLINAGADTTFLFFVEGRPLTITHADGGAIEPLETDALLLGQGERYDVLLDMSAADVQRIVALPLGKAGRAIGVLRRTGTTGTAPGVAAPLRIPARVASYSDMRDPAQTAALTNVRETRLDLGFRGPYTWTLGGQRFPKADVVAVKRGEAQRFVMRNTTNMPHPMHLHGHSFRPAGGGPRKDTIMVLPKREVAVEWVADNPGKWAFHCHNILHAEAGMLRSVEVA
jgi:FtsP/CotA-like multicopper oxidase with cupredoxin domain